MTITTPLHLNPHGYGGADFEAELAPGFGILRLNYDHTQFAAETHAALAEIADGLNFYAADHEEEFGPLASAVFTISKLYGDTSASNLRAYHIAGVLAARDFHKRISA